MTYATKIRLETGTMWHDKMSDLIVSTGAPFMQEVDVAPWLPEGWGGRVDWMFFEDGAIVLRDLKTIKPEGLRWIERGGAKAEHQWQLSAYWHALSAGGFHMHPVIEVMYLPMSDTNDDQLIEPMLVEAELLPRDLVWGVMEDRWAGTRRYLDYRGEDVGGIDVYQAATLYGLGEYSAFDAFANRPFLAPVMEREQKVFWNGKQSVWDLKLVPHWSSMFCPFDDVLCDCSSQGVTKIGHYTLEGVYVPRSGYDEVAPYERPSDADVRLRRGVQNVSL